MKIKKIVEEIIENNNWLNGWYDYLDGDLMAIVNQPEKFQGVVEKEDLAELFNNLQNYEGVFKYKNLLFFNDWHYGTFVYDINNTKDYIEHLSIHWMTLDSFVKTIKRLIK